MPRRLFLALFAVLIAVLALLPASAGAADPLRARQWGLDMIEADAAHSVTRGEGAVVAVIDTGVDTGHPDLAGQLLPGRDFAAEPDDSDPADGDGHGTHVTGIIAAASGNGVGVESVAPAAKVLPIRVLDDQGSGSDTDVAAGIDYAVSKKVNVINLSLGGLPLSALETSGPFAAAIQRAVDAGITVAVAAGNDSLPICEQPAVSGKILCVGAVDKRKMRSFFSSGDSASIMAPGGSAAGGDEDVLSTYKGGGYEPIAGTSQATPHVAGVAALLASRGIQGQAAVDRILDTATPMEPALMYGRGILNARAAVAGLPTSAPGGGGASGGGGTAGGGAAPTAKVYISRGQRMSAVLKRGFRARCRGAAAGRCKVTVTRGTTVLMSGSRSVGAGKTVTFTVKPTRAGKRVLRRGKPFRATARLVAPGGAAKKLTLKFR